MVTSKMPSTVEGITVNLLKADLALQAFCMYQTVHFTGVFRQCTCNNIQVQKYQKRISGPLLDRIDIQIEVPRLSELILVHSARDNRAVSGRRCIGPSPCELASGEGRGGVRVQHARRDQFVRITYRLLARRAQSSPMTQDKSRKRSCYRYVQAKVRAISGAA